MSVSYTHLVRKHMPAMHRYVRLRKKMLGVDELHFYDVYAPLVGDLKKSYTYETCLLYTSRGV